MEIIHIILNKYFIIINDYLQLMTSSNIIKKLSNRDAILIVGIDTITHIFNIILIKNKNIDYASYCSQKAYYCYLEYIEQINIKLMTDELNIKDAVLFIYNKALMDNYKNDKIDNSIKLEDISNVVCKLYNLNNIVTLILNFNNKNITFEDKCYISETFLLKYLLLFHNNDILYQLKIINDKIIMKKDVYYSFLEEYYKFMNVEIKNNREPKQINSEFIHNLYYSNEKLNTTVPMKTFIKHMFIL